MLKEGDKAPDFTSIADDGSTVSLGDYSGKNLILYFYPKANTPGCIHEANAFRNDIQKYEALNTKIVGVSADTVESQTKFKDKHSLNFPLLADTEFKVISAYDARRMKSFLGKTYMGIVRMTFWIDTDGKIKKVWNNVTPKGHGAEVLTALNEG